MARTLPYHGWPFPEPGDTDYEDTFDTFVDQLDDEVIEKDTKTNRPSAGTADRWFLAHDEPAIYWDDGTQWIKIAGRDQTGNNLLADEFHAAHDGGPTDPSFTFDSDQDTGLYRPAIDELGIATNGTEALRVASDQHTITNDGLTVIDPSSGDSSFPVDRNTYYSATYLEGGSHGLGVLLVPEGDAASTTGSDKAAITWRTRAAEKVGSIVAHEEDNEFSVYTRDGTLYDGTEGSTLKALDIRGGSPGQERFVRFQNSARFYWDGKTHGVENRIQFESADTVDTYLQFTEDTNGIGAEIRYQASNQLDFSTGSSNITAVSIDGNQNVDIPNGKVTVQSGITLSERNIVADTSYNVNRLVTSGSSWAFRDSTNGVDIATFDEGGNVSIPNGSAIISTDAILDPTSSGLSDGAAIDSGKSILRGYYDSDGTTTVSATAADAVLQHDVFGSGGSMLTTTVQGTQVTRAFDGGVFQLVNGKLLLDPESDGLTDGGTISPPPATFRGYYDSDGTTTVSATSVEADLKHNVGASGYSKLEAVVQGLLAADFDSNGRFRVPNGSIQVGADIETTGTSPVTIWDSVNGWVPFSQLEASSNIARLDQSEVVASSWQFNDDNGLRFGTGDDYEWVYNSTDTQLKLVADPTSTSPTDVLWFQSDNDAFFEGDVSTLGDLVVSTANNGVLLSPGVSGGTRFGLKYGSANSIGDTDDLMLTNREAGGDLLLAANNGTAGSEAIGIQIPSGSAPKPDAPNGMQSEGVDNPNAQQAPTNALPMSEIPNGDYAAIPVYVPANHELKLWMWGARTDAQGTPTGLTVELYDETGAVSVLSESTARTTGNPIHTFTAGSTANDLTVRLDNATGGAINAGAIFAYTVEAV